VAENVNTDELGDLGLSAEEEAAIVAFLLTLTDGYGMPEPMVPNPGRAPALAKTSPLRAYPNPLRTDGFVEWTGASTSLRLYDASGRLVLTRDVAGRGAGSNRIAWGDLVGHQALASGVYFLHMDGVPQPAKRIVVTR
jgi:hypothetical protein